MYEFTPSITINLISLIEICDLYYLLNLIDINI